MKLELTIFIILYFSYSFAESITNCQKIFKKITYFTYYEETFNNKATTSSKDVYYSINGLYEQARRMIHKDQTKKSYISKRFYEEDETDHELDEFTLLNDFIKKYQEKTKDKCLTVAKFTKSGTSSVRLEDIKGQPLTNLRDKSLVTEKALAKLNKCLKDFKNVFFVFIKQNYKIDKINNDGNEIYFHEKKAPYLAYHFLLSGGNSISRKDSIQLVTIDPK
jgi:hypothetical protein